MTTDTIIGSKLPPHRGPETYFGSGRAAFSYLIGERIRPRRVWLPTFVCWSLVSAMERRFPEIDLRFYSVAPDLTCHYPDSLDTGEALVFVHYFGYENTTPLPPSRGTILEDLSHAWLSSLQLRGDVAFGSYRKLVKVVDGGFVRGAHNPVYEASRKLDSWLRLEATDWRDVREAENMMDRDWALCDISGQSLAVLLTVDRAVVSARRQANERVLADTFPAGTAMGTFAGHEVPMIHNRLLPSTEERDSLRSFLAERSIYTSIHWPTHPRVLAAQDRVDITGARWLEDHILSVPIAEDYDASDMHRVVRAAEAWQRAGGGGS